MSIEIPKRIMVLFSIVEQNKSKKMIEKLNGRNISMHFQCFGYGTAPTEMMDIFGLVSKDKDVIISLAAESAVRSLMSNFGGTFQSYSEFGGLMIVLSPYAVNRVVSEILNHQIPANIVKGDNKDMKNAHNHNLIFISVEQGYADAVMQVARKVGATGGTVIRSRLVDLERFNELAQVNMEGEREIVCILAPVSVSNQILEDVNAKFGLYSDAHGILCAVPVEKAYKI